MNLTEKISVIVPVYNVEAFLERCVRSVCEQTYNDLEIILVDDGSSDGCPEMCDCFAAADKRVKVIHKENGGLSSARNAGIDECTGDWIMFVDSDDFIAPEMVRKLYDAACRYRTDVAYCTVRAFTEDEKGYREFGLWDAPPDSGIVLSGETILRRTVEERQGFLSGHHVVAWNKIYRRYIFDKLRYPWGRQNEDEAIAHDILDACSRIVGINEPLYYYRQHADSIMGKGDSLFRDLSVSMAYGDRLQFFEQRNMAENLGLLYRHYWTVLISDFYLFKTDTCCAAQMCGLLSQMQKLKKTYRRRTDVPMIQRFGVDLFCRIPNIISRLFVLSVRLRNHECVKAGRLRYE